MNRRAAGFLGVLSFAFTCLRGPIGLTGLTAVTALFGAVGMSACGSARAEPPARGGAAAFQASYDHEAVGKIDDALADLDQLPPAWRADYVARVRKAWLLHQAGRYAASQAAYDEAIALARDAIEPRLGQLLPLLADHRWTTAEKAAREVLRRDPGNYYGQLRLAFCLYNQGRHGEALAAYRKLAAAFPGDVDVRAGIGWALLRLGRNAEAQEAFRWVAEVAPKHAGGQEGLAASR